MTRVAIIGGGITGLAAAWELQQQGVDYVVLEAADHLGGKLQTDRVDGFVIEAAADSFLAMQKPWAWQLCCELGLRDRLVSSTAQSRKVYVLKDGRLHEMPRGMRLIVPTDPEGLLESDLMSEEGKRQMLAEADVPPQPPAEDESLASFVRRRFGQEALDVFGESLLAGIYTGNSETLSLQATFPNYITLESKYGSVTKGTLSMMQAAAANPPTATNGPTSMFVALPNGTAELIEVLETQLTGDIRTGHEVTKIEVDPAGSGPVIHTSTGETIKVDAIVLTTPVGPTRKIVADTAPELAEELSAIRTMSSATVSLGYRREDVEHPLDGTGFVVASTEPTNLVASTWSSTKWPNRAPEGFVLLRAFFGGKRSQSDVDLPDEELVKMAHTSLGKLLGIKGEPVISRVYRWRNANVQYEVGHLKRVAHLRSLCPPWLFLTGAPYEGVGIPDCVRQGRQTAKEAAGALQLVKK